MYFEISDEQRSMKELAEKYAVKTIAPIHEKDEAEGIFRPEIVKEMGKLGFWGVIIPQEYGGTNAGFLSAILMVEAISKVSPAYGGHFITQTAGCGLPIVNYGTTKQKREYVPSLVDAELFGCFAATEPDAGSDLTSMRVTADEKNDAFVLNGTKNWITNAPVADVGLIFAVTDKNKKHQGISCFIVDLKNNPGIETRVTEKLGQRCSKVGEILFSDAKVSKDSLLGKIGEGFKLLMNLLNTTRLFAAARALGVEGACLEESIRYASTRIQFGRPIKKFQMIQAQIAEMYINHEAAKMVVYQAAANKDRGKDSILEVSTAKYLACDSAVKSVGTGMKIHGAYGYSMEYIIQRYLRDAQAFVMTEGSSNIQKIIIARQLFSS